MYIASTITDSLNGLIGWRQNYDGTQIGNSLTDSETGIFFQDIHPLLTLNNLENIAPEFSNLIYQDWDVSANYVVGDTVEQDGTKYRCILANVGQSPDTSTTYWELWSGFSQWLLDKTKASINKVVRRFWSEKMAEKRAKSLLENKALFDGAGRMADTVKSSGNLVGFGLTAFRQKGIVTRLKKIGLQFTGTGDITLYLFHSSRSTPIKTQTVSRTRAGGMEWFDLSSWDLPYVSNNIDAGGTWWICYEQDNTDGQIAINKTKDWSKQPCTSCSRGEYANWQIWSRYLEVYPFKVGSYTTGELWDIANNVYTTSENYGINLQLSIECDMTEIMIEQRDTFQNLISLQVASDLLRAMTYNADNRITRTNHNVSFSKDELLYELDGDSRGRKSGLNFQLETAMKAAKLDISGMSKECFPCRNNGLRFKTV